MLYEIVSRRYRRTKPEKRELPDLILIDGGRGQLNAAQQAFADLDLLPPPMAALAKGRKDKREEGIYLPGRKNPLRLKPRSPALRLLDRVRDEVHRFAITYQKKQRRSALSSELDQIPGIGPARRKTLLQHFGSLEKIQKASVEEITQAPGMGRKQAEKLYKQIQMSKPK
jgi:excinuclease ABC subunit C